MILHQGNEGGPRRMPSASRQVAARADPAVHPRRAPCPQLQAPPEPAGAHRMRGLSTPAEAPVQPARQAGHFWVDTGPRKRQDPTTGEDRSPQLERRLAPCCGNLASLPGPDHRLYKQESVTQLSAKICL